MRDTREIIWLKAARKEFETFPEAAQRDMQRALTVAAEGEKADIAKPFKGVGGGVLEIAVNDHRLKPVASGYGSKPDRSAARADGPIRP